MLILNAWTICWRRVLRSLTRFVLNTHGTYVHYKRQKALHNTVTINLLEQWALRFSTLRTIGISHSEYPPKTNWTRGDRNTRFNEEKTIMSFGGRIISCVRVRKIWSLSSEIFFDCIVWMTYPFSQLIWQFFALKSKVVCLPAGVRDLSFTERIMWPSSRHCRRFSFLLGFDLVCLGFYNKQ